MSILEVNNICKKYKDENILSNISFKVGSGEIVGLVGPNGAGKTTIFKIISGLVKSDSGEIIRNGSISGIISKTPVYPFLTGMDHLKYIAKINNEIDIKGIEDIERFIGIGKKINDKVSTYSLGMKQRLCLGIVMLTNSDVILLDEPTNGLDNKGINELRSLLIELSEKRKKTIIISSHNLREIEILCRKIIFINSGKIVNLTDKLDKGNGEIFTINFYTNEVDKINKLGNRYKLSINNNLVNIRCSEVNVKNILEFIIMNNIKFKNLKIINEDNYNLESEYNLYINEGKVDDVI